MSTTQFPAPGNTYEARFGDLAFRLAFDGDGKTLTFAPLDQPHTSESVTYTAVPIREDGAGQFV